MVRKRAIVNGLVQGVGFRYSTRAQATRLGLAGYARNRPDGTVEVEVEGPAASVAELLTWLEAGPSWSGVESVDVSEVPPLGESGFRITS